MGLLMKMIIGPTIVWLADQTTTQVYFSSLYQPIVVGLVLALFAHLMEVRFLNRGTLWTSTILDFMAVTVLVYLIAFLLPGATITLIGALITAFFISVTEVLQHWWLIETGQTRKSR